MVIRINFFTVNEYSRKFSPFIQKIRENSVKSTFVAIKLYLIRPPTLLMEYFSDDCSISETLFYEDLNCKPNIKETEKCPTTYECDSFEMKNDSCLLAGKSYQLGMLADEVTQGASCQVGCMCRKSE